MPTVIYIVLVGRHCLPYLTEKFHPHIHAIVSDGLFRETGSFYVMPDVDLKPLEDIFRASVFKMLKDEGKIDDDVFNKLMNWRHSGFSVHNGSRVARDDEKGKEAISQYIIRNTFSLEKLTYNEETNTVIYVQICKSSIYLPLFYQSRAIQSIIFKKYLNFGNNFTTLTEYLISKFLSSHLYYPY
ncbi:MAG: hypothetical protein D8M57_01750 [Candidatus Scalindua sp. AMX11]|nr:MAG: hypothetical protein DWQ00_15735 [Candidatus Scalindua sp.]NOG85112.1 hypothetical protein [Planctomycetota bacterium]RZV69305.1 MAG: hypothetical protein EX341_16075 [Candidatus Scalindua sp. SCAELEC01]TDE66783.1 MAG: hypothetical protein D8M57_01750 [Candidatus Scalindua sp. AMX11]GJQ60398.1 MAG: hypothetical protein SCALA701_31990 [Candidatus Scalindua sp.]